MEHCGVKHIHQPTPHTESSWQHSQDVVTPESMISVRGGVYQACSRRMQLNFPAVIEHVGKKPLTVVTDIFSGCIRALKEQ
jgi:hypothetical protein